MREMNLNGKDVLTQDKFMFDMAKTGLFGIKIIQDKNIQPVPVLQLSPNLTCCTEKLKSELNRWLLDFFGEKQVAYFFNTKELGAPSDGEDIILMHPRHFAMLASL